MRVQLAAIHCGKGDIEGNLSAHLRLLDQAAAARCDLALFPEMSLTGSADPPPAGAPGALDHRPSPVDPRHR